MTALMLSLVAVCRLLIVVVSPVCLRHMGSEVVAPGRSCFVAYGIFLNQELNLCLLYWQEDS